MLAAIAAEIDTQRINAGEHVSCLFEEAAEEMRETLSPEEAMEKWVGLRQEVASKTSGLRGRAKSEVRMLPKKLVSEKVKIGKERVIEIEDSPEVEEAGVPEMVTSKGVPFVMIDDDDDD